MHKPYSLKSGSPYPHGAKVSEGGVNFSISSRHATDVELLLFSESNNIKPLQVIPLQKDKNHTFFSWHVFVEELPVGTWYAWRIDGPDNTRESGLRFDREKLLLDPWARAISDKLWNRAAACKPGDNSHHAMRAVVVDDRYDWEGDTPLAIRSEKAIIYELHVGGFTRHASAKVKHPGTFIGLIEKIPYLKKLGITHVELLPIMAFDEQDVPPHTSDLGLKNYWGYSTHSFFSPHPGYCVTPEQGTHIREFRDLVKALHKAGIGVIMDVVFNHTSEAGADGPVINFKGITGNSFYLTDKHDKRVFHDYTGCGNTVNANHPLVTNFIISCLEYWVREMHVDGFRFDLASALARSEDGSVLQDPPLVWGIELSEQLAKTKLIAEAWDASGLYQVGNFPGYRWGEWNGRYRDVIRRFLRGDTGIISEVATRICGSSDLYQHQHRLPISGINFVTCHDGFTLKDLFSYNEKHNTANGENNRDGCSNNLSSNCGAEGPTPDPAICKLRRQQVKNSFAILLLSHGVPMLLAGDEFLHTQQGNNNCYCQDNELSWLNWDKAKENADVLHFVQQMIRLRKRHPALMRRNFLTGRKMEGKDLADISWHGLEVDQPPRWDEPSTRILAFTLAALGKDEADLHAIMNMSDSKHSMQLPLIEGTSWCLAVDTAQKSPRDIVEPAEQKALSKPWYIVEPHSIVVFESTHQAGTYEGDSVTKRSANFFSKLTGIKLLDQPATEISTS
ncbi:MULTISPECIES: glycogen debranching protein GlgX [Methylomonas]|uniref:Glycogen debranching enzyme n=2 Tax=Methylomonas TaxID=416 RepID=A0A126T1N5_9GAMM|nr:MULTISPECIES: glycogen debranching protein GlgX [Methylomonas]AMK75996.1 glycogen debranching enzyme [Methylomonas denitrificans]OAH99870.1 glycogen debranching enzyme [Methylomonas methanica]TCV83985.1 glycogen operon protein [Methylomonas methanica]